MTARDAAGAAVAGNLTSGYTARWQEHGQPVSMGITLGQVQ